MVQDWRFASVEQLSPFVKEDTAIYLGTRVDYSNLSINDYSEYFIQKLDAKTGIYRGFISLPASNTARNSSYSKDFMIPTHHGLYKSTGSGTGASIDPNFLRELYDWESGQLLWSKSSSFHPYTNYNTCDTSSLLFGVTEDTAYAVLNARTGDVKKSINIKSLISSLNQISGRNFEVQLRSHKLYYGMGDTIFLILDEPHTLSSRKFVNLKINRKDLTILSYTIWDEWPRFYSACNIVTYFIVDSHDNIRGSVQDSVRRVFWTRLDFGGDTLSVFDYESDYFGKIAESPIWSWSPRISSLDNQTLFISEANSLVNYNIIGSDIQFFDENGQLIRRGKIFPTSTSFRISSIVRLFPDKSFIYTTIGRGLSRMEDWRIGRLDSTMQVNDPQFYTLSADTPMLVNYITVYPNPVEHAFQFAGIFPIANYEMRLYNSAGEQVMRESFHSRNTVFFPAQHLAQGIYFCRISNNDGSLFASGRLLKK